MNLTNKHAVVESLLEDGPVHILPNPNAVDVVVPPMFHGSPTLQLEFGYDIPHTTQDLDVTDEAIAATLGFKGMRSWVFVPWGAIYGVIQIDVVQVAWSGPGPVKAPEQAKPSRGGLRLVTGDAA